MICPLCGTRRARRTCPALSKQICAVCCGTKRMVDIRCPSDCVYLTSAREHPPAVVARRQQRDFNVLARFVHDLDRRQSALFVLIGSFLGAYESPELQPILDEDVAEAAAALAATSETAARGVIYEHRAASLPAQRLGSALGALLVETGKNQGTSFERDASIVLRRIEEAARQQAPVDHDNRRGFLDLLGRVMPKDEAAARSRAGETPRLIVP